MPAGRNARILESLRNKQEPAIEARPRSALSGHGRPSATRRLGLSECTSTRPRFAGRSCLSPCLSCRLRCLSLYLSCRLCCLSPCLSCRLCSIVGRCTLWRSLQFLKSNDTLPTHKVRQLQPHGSNHLLLHPPPKGRCLASGTFYVAAPPGAGAAAGRPLLSLCARGRSTLRSVRSGDGFG